MKKALVLLLTAFSILVLFFLAAGVVVKRGASASADALAGTVEVAPKQLAEASEETVNLAPEPPPPAASDEAMKRTRQQRGVAVGGSGGVFRTLQIVRGAPDDSADRQRADKRGAKEKVEASANVADNSARPTRAWFPETFLFEPLVVTDTAGHASIPVKVPDRLTSWRVLALAHSREGAQAGAATSFLGTLPLYVEPVVPPTLFAGDEVSLPIQVVNTTDQEVTSTLAIESNGRLSSKGGGVKVGANGTAIQTVRLSAPTPGALTLKATLGATDSAERTIDVKPAGQRETVTRGGTLGAPRTFTMTGPQNPLPHSERVALSVFPGALGLLRAELSAAPQRGGVAEDAYLLALVGAAPSLLQNLGGEPNSDVIRKLTLLATQRLMRHSRAPTIDSAALMAEAAFAHPENPVLARLGERLAAQVARSQRPDGTCQGADGWTLQRLLVATADCVRAVQGAQGPGPAAQRATAVIIKAAGAYERNLGRITDPYTAAAALASGAVRGAVAEKLTALVVAGIKTTPEGARLEVPSGVVRSDGFAPSTLEATALAVLALGSQPKAPLADLGTTLLGAYNPFSGWGDGRANLFALRAVTSLFKEKVPAGVAISLSRDGKVLVTGELTPETLKTVLVLEANAEGSAGEHTWTVTAAPPLAGLGFSLGLVASVPWKPTPEAGLELETKLPSDLQVGQPATIALTAAYPGGAEVKLRYGLPAGVQHDTASLDALVTENTITSYETEDGAATLHLPMLQPGETWQGSLRVIPTFAGRLQSAPAMMSLVRRPDRAKTFVPQTWTIR